LLLFRREDAHFLTLKVGELYLQFEHPLHSIVPALFECASNEAVVGIGLLIAAFYQIGLITGTLDPAAPLRGNCFITFFQIVQRFEGELDCHWLISPLLANLFLHYAFDMWMAREFPHILFERYADDAICHCRSAEEEARALWSALGERLAACKLVLHPVKTKIVYCKDVRRRGDFPVITFDFLGFQFRTGKRGGGKARCESSRIASSLLQVRRC
jgi:hypothetical protein